MRLGIVFAGMIAAGSFSLATTGMASEPIANAELSTISVDAQTQIDAIENVLDVRRNTLLGKPIQPYTINTLAAQGVFEHATVLWIPNPRRFYAIPADGKTWNMIDDTYNGTDEWVQMARTKDRLSKFQSHGVPLEGYYPPFGGWALYLDRHPEEWSKYGWQQWHCSVHGSIYREYENGYVFGVYPINPTTRQGKVIILYKSTQSVEFAEVPLPVGDCDANERLENFKE